MFRLPRRWRRYVRTKVESGRYESASEVVRESLRALQEKERGEQQFWAGVSKKIGEARADQVAGRIVDGEAAMASILAEVEIQDRRNSRGKAVTR